MDYAYTTVSDGGESTWSDNSSLISSESNSNTTPSSPLSLTDALWMATASTARFRAGQLSPASTGPSRSGDAYSMSTMMTSSSSSCTDIWNRGVGSRDDVGESVDVEHEDGVNDALGDSVEMSDTHTNNDEAVDETGSLLRIPKLEPMEDAPGLDGLDGTSLESAPGGSSMASMATKEKRRRGRPRKHPLAPLVANSKVTKGRSKTGCITCRKRKKKCDEAKPRCKHFNLSQTRLP